MSPTGLLDSRDPFDLHQPQIGPRMMYGNIANREAFLRRKLEEQQQAAELQGRRFMGLQLLDLKSRGHHLGSLIGSPISLGQTDGKGSGNGNAVHLEDVTIEDNKLNSSIAMSAPASAAVSATDAEGKHEEQQKEEDGDGTPKQAVNPGEEQNRIISSPGAAAPNVACGFQESGVEHNLPGSPFTSPTKISNPATTAQNGNIINNSRHHVASSLFRPTPPILELPPYNSCFFQVPRFSSGHEAIGL
uniref:Nucleic acid binding protein n=1 Tax=Arundo donax TaxID=35708 RepID=A0A0A9DFK9_ARUDO